MWSLTAHSYPVSRSHRASVNSLDPLVLIYTSGTTGLPKAAPFNHMRFYGVSLAFAYLTNATPADRLYAPLPLYHSAGGVVAVSVCWLMNMPLITRRRFSAQAFWSDCVARKATIVQYIGELCRYLVNSPPQPDETRHQVRVALGNGMRPEVWRQFQARFKVPHVAEFYAATEGNASLTNTYGVVGAVGRVSDLMNYVYPVKLIRLDTDTEQPVRGADGLCIVCAPGEAGELVGPIDEVNPMRRFQGYTDTAATEKKIVRNVLRKDDKYFRSGDLLTRDRDGYFFFVDRIGDTFRWKGENVSTAGMNCCGRLWASVCV